MVALLNNQPTRRTPVLSDSAIPAYAFATATSLPLQAAFDGGRLTSDGGLPWLAQADTALGLCALVAAHVPEWRTRASQHPLETLVRQRMFQIACGYADQNDAATLRHDPLLKLVCGRLPETGAALASQPTLSRLDNAMDRRACYRLAVALVHLYLRQRDQQGTPTRILLDLDGTDDPTYGAQEGTAYHAFYRQHMYHPLLIFDGDTNQVITAVLRAGNVHVSRGVVPILKRLVPVLQQRWPGVQVVVRADSGFATPALYELCEQWGVEYSIGLGPNARLKRLAEPVLDAARQRQADAPATTVRQVGDAQYQAQSWTTSRRVIIKAERLEKGPNVRFVVTNRTAEALAQYDDYVDRGAAEGWIKDLKNACYADRLSCHTFWANQFRLLLHAAAYWLLDTLRRWLTQCGSPRMQLDTLRVMLLKIGGRVLQLGHQVRLRLASSHPGQSLWSLLATTRVMNNPG
jgi:Transposase DDE domain group 1